MDEDVCLSPYTKERLKELFCCSDAGADVAGFNEGEKPALSQEVGMRRKKEGEDGESTDEMRVKRHVDAMHAPSIDGDVISLPFPSLLLSCYPSPLSLSLSSSHSRLPSSGYSFRKSDSICLSIKQIVIAGG